MYMFMSVGVWRMELERTAGRVQMNTYVALDLSGNALYQLEMVF